MATSQSAQCLRSLPSLPVPRPFAPQNYAKNNSDNFPTLPPDFHSSSAAYLGLKTPSAFFPVAHTGHTDAQCIADQQACDLISSSADSSKQSAQYSTEYPGRDVAQTLGVVTTSVPTGDEKQYAHFPFPTQVSVLQRSQTMTHARDGTFVSEQQAHEIAYSTQMPVGLVSQQSKALDITRGAPNEVGDNKHVSPSNMRDTGVDIPGENKQTAGDEVRVSRHSEGGNCNSGAYSFEGYSDKPKLPCLQQGVLSGTNFLKDGYLSAEQNSYDVTYSSAAPGHNSSHSSPLSRGIHIASKGSSLSEYPNSAPGFLQVENSDVIPQDAKFVPYSSVLGQVVHSVPIAGDSMPKSALMMQQSHLEQEQPEFATVEHELAGKLEQLTGTGNFFSVY
jgi:hypothetical protein